MNKIWATYLLVLFLSFDDKSNVTDAELLEYEYDDDTFKSDLPQPKILFSMPWYNKHAWRFTTTTAPTTIAPTTTTVPTPTTAPPTTAAPVPVPNPAPNPAPNPGPNPAGDEYFIGYAPMPEFAPDTSDPNDPVRQRRPQLSQQYQPIIIFRQNPNRFGMPFPFLG